jgi:hypothetical protein
VQLAGLERQIAESSTGDF